MAHQDRSRHEAFARAQLENLVEAAGRARLRQGLGDLLDQWFLAASPAWAPTTISHTRSIIDIHLKPHLGHLDVEKLTTVDIDDSTATSCERAAGIIIPSLPGPLPGSTECSTGRSPRPSGGTGSG